MFPSNYHLFADGIRDVQAITDKLDISSFDATSVAVASDKFPESRVVNQNRSIYSDVFMFGQYFRKEVLEHEEHSDDEEETVSVSSTDSSLTNFSHVSNISMKGDDYQVEKYRSRDLIPMRASLRTKRFVASIRKSFSRPFKVLNSSEIDDVKNHIKKDDMTYKIHEKLIENQKLADRLNESRREEERLQRELEEAETRVQGLEHSILSDPRFNTSMNYMQKTIFRNKEKITSMVKTKELLQDRLALNVECVEEMREDKNDEAAKSWELELLINSKRDWLVAPLAGFEDLARSQVKLEAKCSSLRNKLAEIGCPAGDEDINATPEVRQIFLERAKAEANLIKELSQSIHHLETEKIGFSVATNTLQQLVSDLRLKSSLQKDHLAALQSVYSALPKNMCTSTKQKVRQQGLAMKIFSPFRRKLAA